MQLDDAQFMERLHKQGQRLIHNWDIPQELVEMCLDKYGALLRVLKEEEQINPASQKAN